MNIILKEFEDRQAWEFMMIHCKEPCSCHVFNIVVVFTGIGLGKDVVCSVCGKKEDITNYDDF